MSELNFKMGTKTSTVPSSGTSGEVFFTTDENKYGHIYFIDRKNKIINVIPNLLDIAHGGTGATTAAAALTNLGLTATATELNYVKGATSSLQTQLNNKSEKNHTHDYLSLNGGAITGKMDLTSFPNINDNYKMGKTSGASGGIHFKKKDGENDYGNAITWSYSNNDESHAGIYVKSSGSYGTKMYLATTSSFSAGAMAALEIDHAGNISALRGNFKGDLTGNASTATKASSLKYHSTLQTDEAIDGFLEANTLKSTIWGSTSSVGTGNGIIISGGYASTNYGFQLAIDDDPTYFMALRQKGTNGWNEWKRIPMADGTGASGTWGIGITGNASSATKATQDASGNVITSTYATKSELNTAKSTLQTSIDGKAPSSHTHNYAGSSSAGGAANAVAGGVGQSNVYRHVWFSDNNTETVRNYDDDFKYNPSTNTLSVANLSGNATTATKATQDASGNVITSTYATKTELNTAKSNLQASIDGKSASGHTHTVVNGVTPEWSGSISNADAAYLAAWTSDGKKIKALSKSSTKVGSASSADTANALTFVRTTLSIPAAGWYKLAYANTTDPRGSIRFGLNTFGGSYTPYYTELKVSNGWSIVEFFQTGKFEWIDKYRMTSDDSKSYIEAYFNKACEFKLTKRSGSADVDDNNDSIWTLYSTATAGSGTLVSESTHSMHGSIYSSGYINAAGLIRHNSSNNYVLLGGGEHKAISDLSVKSAATATALTSSAGSATQPIYFSSGKPVACTYTLGKSVPSDAKFTDTTYSSATTSANGLMTSAMVTKLNGIATGANAYTHPTTSGNKHIPSGGSSGQILRWSADGTAVWGNDNNTTYSAATQSAQGLMSAADKKKLDGIASGANAYSLPTASSSTLGGVKTTSTVTSTSGLTACPIISGVPYYKDTNTTYSLSSFGITATAAELNYTDGVTSNIQTQLNGKVDLSSTQTVSGVKTFSNGIKIGNTTMSYDSTNKRLVISVT